MTLQDHRVYRDLVLAHENIKQLLYARKERLKFHYLNMATNEVFIIQV